MSFNVDSFAVDLKELSSEEWSVFLAIVQAESDRRYVVDTYEAMAGKLQADYQKATGVLKGEGKEWEQPLGNNTYAVGDVVKFEGKFYKSTRPFNAWSPAVLPEAWQEVAKEDLEPGVGEEQELDYPAWQVGVQYEVGDPVSYQGVAYKVKVANKSQSDWAPDRAVTLFEKIS